MRRLQLLPVAALAVLVLASPSARAAEARNLTAADIAGMGGTDFKGGVGDYLLRNDVIEAVILAVDVTPDFNIPILAEALPGRGVLIDLGTRGDKNDQLGEIGHLVNLGANVIFYAFVRSVHERPDRIGDGERHRPPRPDLDAELPDDLREHDDTR